MSADEAARKAHAEVFGVDPVVGSASRTAWAEERAAMIDRAQQMQVEFLEKTRRQVEVSDRLSAQREAILSVALEMLDNIPGIGEQEKWVVRIEAAKSAEPKSRAPR